MEEIIELKLTLDGKILGRVEMNKKVMERQISKTKTDLTFFASISENLGRNIIELIEEGLKKQEVKNE